MYTLFILSSILLLAKSSRTTADRQHSDRYSQRWSRAGNVFHIHWITPVWRIIAWMAVFHAKTVHALHTKQHRVHSQCHACFKGTSHQIKYLFVPFPFQNYELGGHKLVGDERTPYQHTLSSAGHNSCSAVFSSLMMFQYLGFYNETNKLLNNKMLELDCSTSRDSLLKV